MSAEPASEPCVFCADPDNPHPVATHCPKCHATWTRGSNTAHCPTCHRTFSTPRVFDRHLLSVGCQPPEGVKSKKGEPAFAAKPTSNRWDTPVWHLAGNWTGPS